MSHKRRHIDDSGDEVEIVSTSWDVGPSSGVSSTVQRKRRKPQTAQPRHGQSIMGFDQHPYSFPQMPSSGPVITGSNEPAKPGAGIHQSSSQPTGSSYSIKAADRNPYSYPSMPAKSASQPSTTKTAQPRTQKQQYSSTQPTGPAYSITGADQNPYSYPSMPSASAFQPAAKTIDATELPAKKQRKKKGVDPDALVPEKRGAIFKKACPKNILDRVDRVMSQRCVFLLMFSG